MSNSRYWIATPGSAEPPVGPLSLEDIVARVAAGTTPKNATVCKVGEAVWGPLDDILPKPAAPSPTTIAAPKIAPSMPEGEGPKVSAYLPRATYEQHYANMTSVGTSTSAWGSILKVLGFLAGVGGLVAFALGVVGRNTMMVEVALLVGGVLLVVSGPTLVALGTLVAAVGEAVLALKDIAVNTRITADRSERDSV